MLLYRPLAGRIVAAAFRSVLAGLFATVIAAPSRAVENASQGGSLSPASYEQVAMSEGGDATRGQTVFARATCATCHTVNGSNVLAGPDLFAIGDKFGRRDLIRSILDPSAAIAIGYETTMLELKSGDWFSAS